MSRGFWLPFTLSILAFTVGIGAGINQKRGYSSNPTVLSLEKIAATDPRIERVARAVCIARGIDPDHQGPPFPDGPIWEFYILQSRDFLAAYDAAQAWSERRSGRQGPPTP